MGARGHLTFCVLLLTTRPANRSARIGLLQHLVTRPADHAEKTKLEEPERSSDQSALAVIPVCASVSDSVRDPRHNPSHAHDRRRHRVSESCDQQRSNEHAVVLEEVAVCSLRAVEQVHLLLLLGSGSAHVAVLGVLLGVGDAGGFAESSNAASVPEADLLSHLLASRTDELCRDERGAYEEGAGCREKDIAVELMSVHLVAIDADNSKTASLVAAGISLTRIPGG